MALPKKILHETKVLLYKHSSLFWLFVTDEKQFNKSVANVIKLFTAVSYDFS